MPEDFAIQFKKLFLGHYRRLYVHAVGFVKDAETAKDIVNEAYARLWEHRFRMLSGENSLPMLYLSVRNIAIDHLRHQKVKDKFETNAKIFLPADDLADYEHFEERVLAAMRAVEQLPPKTRQIFKECFIEGYTHKAAAAKYGISVNTIRNHVAHAIGVLRRGRDF